MGLITLSSLLGIVVSLSTFLVISVTSSLTYTVIGHIKTLVVLSAGVLIFGDTMDVKKLSGIAIAMVNPTPARVLSPPHNAVFLYAPVCGVPRV